MTKLIVNICSPTYFIPPEGIATVVFAQLVEGPPYPLVEGAHVCSGASCYVLKNLSGFLMFSKYLWRYFLLNIKHGTSHSELYLACAPTLYRLLTLILVRPPKTVVPDGLMFYCGCFFSFAITELPRPIAVCRETLPHDRQRRACHFKLFCEMAGVQKQHMARPVSDSNKSTLCN